MHSWEDRWKGVTSTEILKVRHGSSTIFLGEYFVFAFSRLKLNLWKWINAIIETFVTSLVDSCCVPSIHVTDWRHEKQKLVNSF